VNTETPKTVFGMLATKSAILDAWRIVQRKRSAGGIDKVSVEYYEKDFNQNIDILLNSLLDGSYVPEPYQRVLMRKEGDPGEFRPLSLPTINDKIVQQALKDIIEPIVNPIFSDVSYAYRPGKGSVKAILRISHTITTNKIAWAFCADIDSFFDKMDHDILLAEFQKYVNEPEICKIVRMWLKIGVVSPKGEYEDSGCGVAQGGVISPLLSNIYLHPFDVYLTQKGCHYIRYADNFILLASSRERIQNDFDAVMYFLNHVLKLAVNHQKSYFYELKAGFVFMGIFFKGESRYLDRSRIQRMESRITKLVRDRFIDNPNSFYKKLEERISGFESYYGKLIQTKNIIKNFNLFMQKAIVERLFAQSRKKNERPNKTHIKAMLSPIRLFGIRDTSVKDQWIIEVANQCAEQFETYKKKFQAPSETLKQQSPPEPVKPAETEAQKPDAPPAPDPLKTADQAVKKQKAKYKKLETVSREVIIENYGVFVGRNYKNLVAKQKGVKVMEFPLEKIGTLIITSKGTSLSSALIWYCSEKGIPVFFSEKNGVPACVLQNIQKGDADLGLLQLQCLQDGHMALELAKEFVEGKIRNQINLMKYYKRHRLAASLYGSALGDEIPEFHRSIKQIQALSLENRNLLDSRNVLMGYEADAARRYWKLVKILLSDDVPDFPGRVGHGATDLVNSLLNYGYGFLYRQVWREVVLAGLNPKISFLHSPQGEKPVLIYDLVEEFRPQAVDRVVLSMLTKNESLAVDKASGLLEKKSLKKLSDALLERQGTAVAYQGEKVVLKHVIKQQVRKLCRHLKGEITYRHFTGYY